MLRNFPSTLVGPAAFSRWVARSAASWLPTPRESKANQSSLRAAHPVKLAAVLLLLAIHLRSGIICRAQESITGSSIELAQDPNASPAGPDRIEHAGERLARAKPDRKCVVFTQSGVCRAQSAGNFSLITLRPDTTQKNSTRLLGDDADVGLITQHVLWRFAWFRITCFGLCLMSVVLIYRLRMLHLTHQLNVRFQERLAERTRIAQELHDTLLQSFQGLILRFQIARETVLSDPLYAKDQLEQALNRADQTLTESRKAIQGIRSVVSGQRGVADSLDAMMNGLVEEYCWGKTPPLNTSVTAEGQPRAVNSCVAEEVCRIAREALWNSFFHARAQRVESEVAYSDRFLRLRFRDDGIGIDSEILKNRGREGHWGIRGMYERAKNIHAGLSIWSRPGAGTEVELTVPAFIAYDAAPSRGWFALSKRKEQVPSC